MPSQELAQEEQQAQTNERHNDNHFECGEYETIFLLLVLHGVLWFFFLPVLVIGVAHLWSDGAAAVVGMIVAMLLMHQWYKTIQLVRSNSFLDDTSESFPTDPSTGSDPRTDALQRHLPRILLDKIAAPAA